MSGDDVPILGRGDDLRLFQTFEAQYDAPAYVRRARQVEDAWEQVLQRCRARRDGWLFMVRIRLGLLRGLAGPLVKSPGGPPRMDSTSARLIPSLIRS